MPRPQFTLRALLVAVLVVGAFLGGIYFEHGRKIAKRDAALVELEAEMAAIEEENVALRRVLDSANVHWDGSTKEHQRSNRARQ
ncbi:MAG TPA: hypothetical protein VHC22_06895 [Pirellulales bacterium]|nr:hypothetical protein [Pirellulales bacterium]